MTEQRPGLAQQVQRDIAQRDVLLDLRGPGDPFAQSLGEDERVIAEPENVGGEGGLIDIDSIVGAVDRLMDRAGSSHKWDTPSGTS